MSLEDDSVELDGLAASVAMKDELASESDSQPSSLRQSRIISRVLAPALRLWLRSQLDHVDNLELTIAAGDRQLFSGAISQVSASATRAVYQGLHLSHVSVVGNGIQTNLRQMLRGQPFRLLAPFPVHGKVTLSADDLNASFNASLLTQAATDFLLTLLRPTAQSSNPLLDQIGQSAQLRHVRVELGAGEIVFKATLVANDKEYPITVRTQMTVEHGNLLKLDHLQCWSDRADLLTPTAVPDSLIINLGSDVSLEELSIHPDNVVCRGQVTVMPGEP